MQARRLIIAGITCSTIIASTALAGTVTGKINFKGTKPAPVKITMNSDKVCLKIHEGKDVMSDQVVVNPNNTLEYVFVYVKSGLEGKKFPTPTSKVTIDQQGCQYHPHIFGVMTNQPIEVINSDNTLHNIHALPKANKGFNIAQPKQGMKMTQKFDKPEIMVKVKCEVHNWMSAYIGVCDNPFFAVSDNQGNFTIKNLPAGTYELEAWHEKYGTQTMKVTVGASDTQTADFTYTAK
jgi:hypothetical protein